MFGFSPLSSVPFSSLSGKVYAVTISESASAADQELYSFNPGGLITESGSASQSEDRLVILQSFTSNYNASPFTDLITPLTQSSGNQAIGYNSSHVGVGVKFLAETSGQVGFVKIRGYVFNSSGGSPTLSDVHISLWSLVSNVDTSDLDVQLATLSIPANKFDQNSFDFSSFGINLTAGNGYGITVTVGADWATNLNNLTYTTAYYNGGNIEAGIFNEFNTKQTAIVSSDGTSWGNDNTRILAFALTQPTDTLDSTNRTLLALGTLLENSTSASDTENRLVTALRDVTENGSGQDSQNRTADATRDATETGSGQDSQYNTLLADCRIYELSNKNLLTRYSNDFTSWSGNPAQVTANVTTSPDGSNTADFILKTAVLQLTGVYIGIGGTNTGRGQSNTSYVGSVYVKPAGYTNVRVDFENSGFSLVAKGANFLLSGAGSVNNTFGGTTATITDVGNGWYRLSVTATTDAIPLGTAYIFSITILDPTYALSFVGDGTSGLYLWGAQVEYGSIMTAYTSSSMVEDLTGNYSTTQLLTETGSGVESSNRSVDSNRLLTETGSGQDSQNRTADATRDVTETGSGQDSQYNVYTGIARVNERVSKNRYLNSEDATLWGLSNVTVNANSIANPLDGALTADQLTNTVNVNSSVTVTNLSGGAYRSGTTFTKSVYAKLITGQQYLAFQAIPITAAGTQGSPYFTASFDLLNGVVSSNSAPTTASITSVGNAWYRCAITFTVPSTNGNGNNQSIIGDSIFIGAYGAATSSTTIAVWGVQLEEGSSATAYEYSGSNASIGGSSADILSGGFTTLSNLTETGSGLDSQYNIITRDTILNETGSGSDSQYNITTFDTILNETGSGSDSQYNTAIFVNRALESTRKNILNSPENLALSTGAGWIQTNVTVASTQSDPDGGTLAFLITEANGIVTGKELRQSLNYSVNGTYTASIYAKANGRTQFRFALGTQAVVFDISTQTSTPGTGWTNAVITSVGGGWYRCSATVTPTVFTGNTYNIWLTLCSGGVTSYTGDGVSGIYWYHPQLEEGSTLTAWSLSNSVDNLNANYSTTSNLTETGTTTDTPLLGNYSTTSNLTETGTTTDTQDRVITALRDIIETASLTDVQITGYPWAAALTETITASETEDRTSTPGVALTETGTASETQDRVITALRDITETSSGQDSQYNTTIRLSDVTETATANNTQDRFVTSLRDVSETATASETEDRLVTAARDVTETSSGQDSQYNTFVTAPQLITETGASGDSQNRSVLSLRDVTETSSGQDSQYNITTRLSDVTETATASETEDRLVTAVRSITENGLSLLDQQYNTFVTAPQLITETGASGDSQNRSVLSLRDVTETSSGNDSQYNIVTFLSLITESGNASELEDRTFNVNRALTESSTGQDSQYNNLVRLAGLIETISGTDLTQSQTNFISAIQEALNALESNTRNVYSSRDILEQLTVAEQQSTTAFYVSNLSELLNAITEEDGSTGNFITESIHAIDSAFMAKLINKNVLEEITAIDIIPPATFSFKFAIREVTEAREVVVNWIYVAIDYDILGQQFSTMEQSVDYIYMDEIDVYYVDASKMIDIVEVEVDSIYIDDIDVFYDNLAILGDVEPDTVTL